MIVNEYALHLGIGILAIFLILKLDEGVLQTFAGPLISDHLTGENLTEATENGVQILI